MVTGRTRDQRIGSIALQFIRPIETIPESITTRINVVARTVLTFRFVRVILAIDDDRSQIRHSVAHGVERDVGPKKVDKG